MREITAGHGIDPQQLPDSLLQATEPVVVRGLVAHWPAVQTAQQSVASAVQYLQSCWHDATVGIFLGPPDIEGRFFYNDAFTGFNFRREMGKLDAVLEALQQLADEPHPPALYVGSTTVDTCLPGFRAGNDLGFGQRDPLMSVWLGNRTCIAAHFDLPDNLACVVAGRRRFTLFPPDEVANLYVGPLDLTPAGQAISLVDMRQPDLARHPRFAQAQRRAQVAELAPGDAVFIPSLWWHQVEALDPFNMLVNYWWRQSPEHMDSPMATLMLAFLTLRDLPPAQRQAWHALFQHYIFDADAQTSAHIPPHARSALGPLTSDGARQLRAQLLKRLNR